MKWLILRIVALMLIPLGMTFYLVACFEFNSRFQPLLKDSKIYIPGPREYIDYDVLNKFLDPGILKYETKILNNTKVVIGGDKKDYEHELEIFVKDDKSREIEINYGESKTIFEREKRDKTISKLKDIVFRLNIDLKPELLIDNTMITANKEIIGYVEIIVKLTYFSWFILYFLSLGFIITMLILLKEVYRFIVCGKKYFLN